LFWRHWQCIVESLARRSAVRRIIATCHRNPSTLDHPKVTWQRLDLTDEAAVRDWAQGTGEIDWLINATGRLYTPAKDPEKSIHQIDPGFFLQNLSVNTLPALLLAKHVQDRFRHGRPAIFATLSARVGSIEDNRLAGWFSYRASKAALNMCLKTLAIEWRRTLPDIVVIALRPSTTDTSLSRPFQRNVPPEQLFTPAQTVSYLLNILDTVKPAHKVRNKGDFQLLGDEESITPGA